MQPDRPLTGPDTPDTAAVNGRRTGEDRGVPMGGTTASHTQRVPITGLLVTP